MSCWSKGQWNKISTKQMGGNIKIQRNKSISDCFHKFPLWLYSRKFQLYHVDYLDELQQISCSCKLPLMSTTGYLAEKQQLPILVQFNLNPRSTALEASIVYSHERPKWIVLKCLQHFVYNPMHLFSVVFREQHQVWFQFPNTQRRMWKANAIFFNLTWFYKLRYIKAWQINESGC